MWLALWCPIRGSCWLWLTSTVSGAHWRSCATVKPWRSWSSRSSLRPLWQVRRGPRGSESTAPSSTHESMQILPGRTWVTSSCLVFFCRSPARALRDPSQDLPESRPVDSWDWISDRRVQAQTQAAENTLPGRHWENVRWEMTRTSVALVSFKAQTNTWLRTLPEPSHYSAMNIRATVY